jgi:hypothetical protein
MIMSCSMSSHVRGLLNGEDTGRLLIKDVSNDRKISRQDVLKFYKNQPMSIYLQLRWI